MADKAKSSGDAKKKDSRPGCGIIAPISATASHSEAHWADVLKLLHRAIDQAGFAPFNVWENATTDRISERIVSQVFESEIVVADISDLNPNVMLELGLRLASKKPTVVIVNKGGTIPFDIGDFELLKYPPDLNILGMEKFFEDLCDALKSKHNSFKSDNYTPFLGKIVVDVLSPQTREVGPDELILSTLAQISSRLGRLEEREESQRSATLLEEVRAAPLRGWFIAHAPPDRVDELHGALAEEFEVDGFELVSSEMARVNAPEGQVLVRVPISGSSNRARTQSKLTQIVNHHGGEVRRFIYR